MRKRSLAPLVACAVVLLICRRAFSTRKQVDAEQQTETAIALGIPGGTNTLRQFHGRSCIDDCTGYEAGYTWAGEYHIGDVLDCIGETEPFLAGCRIYVEELRYTRLRD